MSVSVSVCARARVCGVASTHAGGRAGTKAGGWDTHRRSTMSKTRTLPVADTYATSGTDSALHPPSPVRPSTGADCDACAKGAREGGPSHSAWLRPPRTGSCGGFVRVRVRVLKGLGFKGSGFRV